MHGAMGGDPGGGGGGGAAGTFACAHIGACISTAASSHRFVIIICLYIPPKMEDLNLNSCTHARGWGFTP